MGLLSQLFARATLHGTSPELRASSLDETILRKSSFVEGTRIVLSDGQAWSLPRRAAGQPDAEYDALLRGLCEAEDWAELLRGELALAIFLLTRNYELKSGDLDILLSYREGDQAKVQMQREFHVFAMEQAAVAQGGSTTEA